MIIIDESMYPALFIGLPLALFVIFDQLRKYLKERKFRKLEEENA